MLSKNKENSNEREFNRNILFGLFLILILIGKVIRYTIMKNVLVDSAGGYSLINSIVFGEKKFSLFNKDSMISDPAGNAIVIYKAINLFKLNSYIGWEIYISFLWNGILLLLLANVEKKLKLKQILFIALSVIVLNIFDFTLAKEPIQMLYFIFIYIILCAKTIGDKMKYIYVVCVVLLSAITYRAYYFLIIVFMFFIQILIKIFVFGKSKLKFKDVVLLIIAIGIFYFGFLSIVKGAMPDQYAELIRVRTRTSAAASDMRNIFKSTNLFIFSIDYVIMIFRMLFPVELLRLGIKYFPYVFYQIIITILLVKEIKNIKHNTKVKNIAIYVFLGFLHLQ